MFANFQHRKLVTASGLVTICVSLSASSALGHAPLADSVAKQTRILAQTPADPQALIERARLQRLRGRSAAALVDLDLVLKDRPSDRRATYEKVLALANLHRDDEAVVLLDSLIEQNPAAIAALNERAKLHARNGRAKAAIADYDDSIAHHPSLPAYLERGRLLIADGMLDRAATGYRDAVARLGRSVSLLRAMAELETTRGRYDAALQLVDTGLARAGVKTRWYLQRATVLDAAGRDEEAARDRNRALAEAESVLSKRSTPLNLLARARVRLALGHCAEATADASQAMRRVPALAAAREVLESARACTKRTVAM
jgi:tetratricopeptide (TPR) repeat protein